MNPLVPDFILKRDAEGQSAGTFEAAALFVDISGFTSLTARLMLHGRRGREGAEILVRSLRFHFDPLVAAVHDAGGFITGFAGDACTALFPLAAPPRPRSGTVPPPPMGARKSPPSAPPPPLVPSGPTGTSPLAPRVGPVSKSKWGTMPIPIGGRPPSPTALAAIPPLPPAPTMFPRRAAAEDALLAANRMQRFFVDNPIYRSPFGDFPFSIRVGISFGQVAYWIVHPTPTQASYFFQGPAIDAAAAIEHRARAGDVLFDAALRDRIVGKVEARQIAPDLFMAIPTGPVSQIPASSSTSAVPESGVFTAPGISAFPPQGEFREVASVFAGFDPVPSPPELITLLHTLAARYGGTFTGLDSGDKGVNCLIHFGAPVSHENDTERALDFALELRRTLPAPTRIRAGITRGIRYVGFNGGTRRMEFACLGRATNLAARLMTSAQWGDIYCEPDVDSEAQGAYQLRERGMLQLKGFDQPVNVVSLTAKKQLGTHKEFLAKELVGRRSELERLTRAIEPIFSTAQGPGRFAGMVYIDGEAGLGKSYLVETYRRAVAAQKSPPPLWITATCDQTLQTSLNALEAALKEYCQIEDAGPKEQQHQRLNAALDQLIARVPESGAWLRRELDEARSIFGALLGLHYPGSLYERLDPRARFERTLAALFAWLRAESLTRPVIVHLEDAQWADDDTLRAILAITRSAAAGEPKAAIVIVNTARFRDDGTPFRVELDRGVPCEEIALGPLSPEDIGRIASNVMGRPLPDYFRALLLEHAGGNPFFTEEILAYWGDADAQSPMADVSFSSPSVALLPRDVNSLLTSRLDRLPSALKLTVFAASVLGIEFDRRILVAMLDGRPEIDGHIRAIEKQRIWLPLGPVRVRFRNTLLRNAAYELQARARLSRLHLKAAEVIEATYADDIDGHLAELARHYRRAEADDRARHYLLRAARRATSRYAHAQARRLYKSYLKLVREPTQESVVVRHELARDVLEPSGALAKAWDEHTRVIGEAQMVGSRALEALGWLGRGRVRWAAHQLAEAVPCLEQGLAISREISGRWTERRALAHLALVYRALGRHREALAAFEQALRIAQELGEQAEATPFGDIVRRYLTEGRSDIALALFEQASVPGPKAA